MDGNFIVYFVDTKVLSSCYNLQYTIAMLGYGPEDTSSVMELTYNYGVTEYDKGNAYAQVALHILVAPLLYMSYVILVAHYLNQLNSYNQKWPKPFKTICLQRLT